MALGIGQQRIGGLIKQSGGRFLPDQLIFHIRVAPRFRGNPAKGQLGRLYLAVLQGNDGSDRYKREGIG